MGYDIRNVRNMTDLIGYFSQKLNWAIDIDDFEDIEDISYDFEAEDIGLKEDNFAKISSLRQLQPLVDGQQWGIFCVEFDSNKFEVSALRKILSKFVPKRRSSVDHAVWKQQDLLFICNWGDNNNRTIGIAHFEDKEKGLPQIKMISCAPAIEDFKHITVFEERLSHLSWPKNTSNTEEWRELWSSAFTMGYRQIIQDSSTLTIQLAKEAKNIRDLILSILKVETKNGYVHLLYEKFKNTLIHDMTEVQFADMYAQTVVYGLFSARCMDTTQEDFSVVEAIQCIPKTNPFLRSLMEECLGAGNVGKLSFDELEIGNIVDLLLNTKTDEIIQDFNRQTGGGKEDPVIHFYEEFLTAYDKEQKVQRGVFYTPQPVVTFMVKVVDDLLKKEFGLVDGLASTENRKIKVTQVSKRKTKGLYKNIEVVKEVPSVQILDPATGTGTFLRQIIIQIYRNVRDNYKRLTKDEFLKIWNEYVPNNLLPRMTGFELMMAPYAVAHMKLAMILKDSGYDFNAENRLQVYLTNTLEKPGNDSMQMTLFDDPLAIESIEANDKKKNSKINVVIGNPPYSGESANKNEWIMELMDAYKKEPGGLIKLNEKNPKWLNDDYVKFIRYAQSLIEQTGDGILAYICPHGFLDNPTFRGMRWNLMHTFSKLFIVDLHGNAKKGERAPDGSKDENVFDIQQGVCMLFAVKKKNLFSLAEVYHVDLYGKREKKYDILRRARLENIQFSRCEPISPQYFFVPKDFTTGEEYNTKEFFSVEELLPANSVGFVSARDKLCIQDSPEVLLEIVSDFSEKDTEIARVDYKLGKDVRDWHVEWAQEDININRKENGSINEEFVQEVSYRPFDAKYTYYTGKSKGFQCYPRYDVMKHLIGNANVALCLNKVVKNGDTYQHCFVADKPIDACYVSNKTSEITYAFPLYTNVNGFRRPNISEEIAKEFEKRVMIEYTYTGEGLKPEHIFSYVYAMLFSKKYREKYVEFLKVGFPRIRYPKNKEEFFVIASLGEKLLELHLEKEELEVDEKMFCTEGNPVIKKISFGENRIYINDTDYFSVREEEWKYKIGCYQVLEKWLKDRKGVLLTHKEIKQYLYIVMAIRRTLSIMDEIDQSFVFQDY